MPCSPYCTKGGLMLIGPLETNCIGLLKEKQHFSFKKKRRNVISKMTTIWSLTQFVKFALAEVKIHVSQHDFWLADWCAARQTDVRFKTRINLRGLKDGDFAQLMSKAVNIHRRVGWKGRGCCQYGQLKVVRHIVEESKCRTNCLAWDH